MAQNETTRRKRLFINQNFCLLFWGRLVSQIGDGIHYFALTWLVLDLTGSGAALGSVLLASSLPAVILAPFTGVLADMWNRKVIVVLTDVFRGLILLSLGGIYYLGNLGMPILYVGTVLLSLCGVLFGPAISASIPGMVKKEELVHANALNSLSRSATGIVGPLIGAYLLGFTGYAGVFLVTGTSFLLSAISEMLIKFPKQELALNHPAERQERPVKQFIKNFKQGLSYIWHSNGIRTIILFAVVLNFIATPIFNVVFPYFGKEILMMEAQHYGLTQSSLPAGLLLGTLIIGLLTKRIRKDRLLVIGIIGQGAIVLLISIVALPYMYLNMSPLMIVTSLMIPIFFLGVLNVLVNVPFQVMLQETVPDQYRGRVFGLIDSTVQMLVPISMALFGVLVDVIAPFYFLLLCGGVVIVLGIAMARSNSIRIMYDDPSLRTCV